MNKYSAKASTGLSVGFLHISIKPSVIKGTTLSAKYYLKGYDLLSNISLSYYLFYYSLISDSLSDNYLACSSF